MTRCPSANRLQEHKLALDCLNVTVVTPFNLFAWLSVSPAIFFAVFTRFQVIAATFTDVFLALHVTVITCLEAVECSPVFGSPLL